MNSHTCVCGALVEGADMQLFGDAFLDHVRAEHPDWAQYPDAAVRNYAEATQRATGPTERLESLPGEVEVRRVTEAELDDWTTFFDRDAFPDNYPWAACYCSEPIRVADPVERDTTWQENREDMRSWLRGGRAAGYLVYVDGKAAGWCNASPKGNVRWRSADDAVDEGVVAVSCFVIAPPYRGHGLARTLLTEVVRDAPLRGVRAVEGYPKPAAEGDGSNYHGPLSLYLEAGFEVVEERDDVTVVRKPVSA